MPSLIRTYHNTQTTEQHIEHSLWKNFYMIVVKTNIINCFSFINWECLLACFHSFTTLAMHMYVMCI